MIFPKPERLAALLLARARGAADLALPGYSHQRIKDFLG